MPKWYDKKERDKMEYEIRFYYSKREKENLLDKLNKIEKLKNMGTFYEKTTQYNSTLPENDFYSKEIDGRYRIRITKGDTESKCMLSWKRRLPDTKEGLINKEEEIECRINPEDYENFIYITEHILKMDRVESYERYRTNYANDLVEIAVDQYPFGIALEIEAKADSNQNQIIDEYVKLLGLDYNDAYRLSWDDKYEELCKEQNIEKVADVLFDCANMPLVK